MTPVAEKLIANPDGFFSETGRLKLERLSYICLISRSCRRAIFRVWEVESKVQSPMSKLSKAAESTGRH